MDHFSAQFVGYAKDSRFGDSRMREAARKFATGIYLVWYAIKSQAEADAFCGEVLAGDGSFGQWNRSTIT